MAAVSSFAFVEAMGPVYAGKLLRDALGFGKGKGPDAARPRFAESLDLETKAGMAESVLKAMSLTEGFGRFVLICGHGANVVNIPMPARCIAVPVAVMPATSTRVCLPVCSTTRLSARGLPKRRFGFRRIRCFWQACTTRPRTV